MSQRWYYQLFGEEFGPVTEADLRQLIADGTVGEDDLLRRETSTEWIPAGDVLSEIANEPDPEQLTDLSELDFQFEESGGAGLRRQTAASGGGGATDSSVDVASRSPSGARFSADEDSAGDPAVWYCESLGQVLGPMPLTELERMAESGSLSGTDLVREGETGGWRPAADVEELATTFLLGDRTDGAASTFTGTTARRLGESAVAALTESPQELPPEVPAPQPAKANAAAAGAAAGPDEPKQKPPARRSRSGSSSGTGSKLRKPSEKKKEDAVLNEIFDEVFTEEPAPPRRSVTPQTVSDASPASDTSPSIPALSAPSPVSMASPGGGASMSATSAAAGRTAAAIAASVRHTSPASSSSSSRGSRGISIPMPDPKILLGLVLVLGIGGGIWQFGLPISFVSYSPAEFPQRLKIAVDEYKAMGAGLTESNWSSYANSKRAEFKAQYETLLQSGASDEKTKALINATKAAMSFVAADFKTPDYRKSTFEKLEAAVAELK